MTSSLLSDASTRLTLAIIHTWPECGQWTPNPLFSQSRYLDETLLEPSRRVDDEALQIVIADITKGVRHIARTISTRTSTAYNRSPDVQLGPGDADGYVGRDRLSAGTPKGPFLCWADRLKQAALHLAAPAAISVSC
jgi:hypothetical protein